jgi:hypothetical protein
MSIKGTVHQEDVTIVNIYAPYIGAWNFIKKTPQLNFTKDQMDLTDIYRIFLSTSVKYIFFSAVHGIFSKIDDLLGHETSLNKYKKIKPISCIISINK